MYTVTTPLETVGTIDIVKRQNLGNAAYEFILFREGKMLYDDTSPKLAPHIYFSLSIARHYARQLNAKHE